MEKDTKKMITPFIVPVEWMASGYVIVEDENVSTSEEAIAFVQKNEDRFNLPHTWDYIEDSFHVTGAKDSMNETIAMTEDFTKEYNGGTWGNGIEFGRKVY